MTTILHISGDYPDAFQSRKTSAVKNLVEGTPQFQHIVYSINRLNGLGGIQIIDDRDDVISLVYKAPPYAILLETYLEKLAVWIAEDVRRRGLKVDLIHSHKLTIEGFVASSLSQKLSGVPFISTVRGNTDQKYFRARPDKIDAFRGTARGASALLPVTPWIARDLESRSMIDSANALSMLPTVSKSYKFLPPSPGNGRLVTVFHLAGWRLKGLPNLLAALVAVRKAGYEVKLDIIGGGSPKMTETVKRLIAKSGVSEAVTLVGHVSSEAMPSTLNQYTGFVLPTLRETFGMVYLEALFASLPILYSKDRGVDGFFDDLDVGVRIDPRSVKSISDGIVDLFDNSSEKKAAILAAQQAGEFRRFTKEAVYETYASVVHSLVDFKQVRVA